MYSLFTQQPPVAFSHVQLPTTLPHTTPPTQYPHTTPPTGAVSLLWTLLGACPTSTLAALHTLTSSPQTSSSAATAQPRLLTWACHAHSPRCVVSVAFVVPCLLRLFVLCLSHKRVLRLSLCVCVCVPMSVACVPMCVCRIFRMVAMHTSLFLRIFSTAYSTPQIHTPPLFRTW